MRGLPVPSIFLEITHRNCCIKKKNLISGEAIARENGIRFLETSAKTNVNIDRAFIELSESILDKTVDVQEARQPLPPPNQSSNRSQCCSN